VTTGSSTSSYGGLVATGWPRPDIAVVRLGGDLDGATAPHVTIFLRTLVVGGIKHLVLDLTAVTFMAARGVGMMVSLQDKGSRPVPSPPCRGGTHRAVRPSEHPRHAAAVCGPQMTR